MSTGQPPKKKASEKKAPHATHFKVANGEKRPAWIAGPLHGVPGHRTHAHQPCVRVVTEGKLQCPYCTAGLPEVWRGFVPLWDRDWVLHYVLIGEEYYPTVSTMLRGDQVIVSRAKSMRSPLVIHAEVSFTRRLPEEPPYNADVSMLELCLRLWQCDELTLWYQRRAATDSVVDAVKAVPSVIVKPARGPAERLAEAEARARLKDKEEEQKIGRVARTIFKDVPNGHAKPKG